MYTKETSNLAPRYCISVSLNHR